ncbi:MAG: ribonuclease R [Chlamydiales bacterium]|jgi:ribonuclease R|nr:ribonuclease R [Chlamydiales bacterium]
MVKRKKGLSSQKCAKLILEYIQKSSYQPIISEELFTKIHLSPSSSSTFQLAIDTLIKNHQIYLRKKKLYPTRQSQEQILNGILRLHPKGFGFVIPDERTKWPQDIFIPKSYTESAIDGDSVRVVVNASSSSEKGPEGKILSVLKRAHSQLAGTVCAVHSTRELAAHVPLLESNKPIIIHSSPSISCKIGDRIILRVDEWGTKEKPTICTVSQIIGNIIDPSCDVRATTLEFNLRSDFPEHVIAETKNFGNKVRASDLKNRMDLTGVTCFTIDPDTAKDFDDALSLTKDEKGHFHLGIHIADVAHYVKPNSPLDQEALLRANSTYFPGTCIPMLPEELSNQLCSLKAHVNRLTVSVLIKMDQEGKVLHFEIVRSYIKSAKRFSYFEAKEVLDGKKKNVHAPTLQLMVDLCLLLKKQRRERGSIDFSLPEISLVVDKNGLPLEVKKIEYDITHQLVEEFMLKANELVALELTNRGKPLIYRVHEEPNPENMKEFFELARTFGLNVASNSTFKNIPELFQQAQGSPFLSQFSIAFIRSMKLAQYSTENTGHFGLCLEHYCHFTSPIRRYSDLVVQRLLFNEESKELDLKEIAAHCSERERISFRAENRVVTLKKLRLLEKEFLRDPLRYHAAIVTKIKPFGLYFELIEFMLEGFLHISELEDDYFIFDEKSSILKGRFTGHIHGLGEKISVQIARIDLIFLESRWVLKQQPNSKKRRRNR